MNVTGTLALLLQYALAGLVGLAELAGLVVTIALRRWLGGRASTLAACGFGLLFLGHLINVLWSRLIPTVIEQLGSENLSTVLTIASFVFALIYLVGTALLVSAFVAVAVRIRNAYAGPAEPPASSSGSGSGSLG